MSLGAGRKMISGGMGQFLQMFCVIIALALPFSLQATTAHGASLEDGDASGAVLSFAAQQRLAAKLFDDLYKIAGQRGEALVAKKIDLYQRIINRCPDVPLAQECYWHLLDVMMQDVQPPRKEEALRLYADFNRRYPQSKMRSVVSHQLMKGLYQHGQWSDLERIATQYLQTTRKRKNGAPSAPLALFWRAEARFSLGEVEAAKKGYGKILQYFPKSLMARVARQRMAATGDKAKVEN